MIGFTLAVDHESQVILIATIFYRMHLHQNLPHHADWNAHHDLGTEIFDGLALGSRLAYLALPHKYRYVPFLGAFLYGITSPIGIAMGLGVRMTYNPSSLHASLVSGILEFLSAGIFMYSGFVELLANGFLSSPEVCRETGF